MAHRPNIDEVIDRLTDSGGSQDVRPTTVHTKLEIPQPQSVSLSYDPASHQLKISHVVVRNGSDKAIDTTYRVVVGRGADVLQTLRDDLHFSIAGGAEVNISPVTLEISTITLEFPLDLERDIGAVDGKDYYVALILNRPEGRIGKFSLEGVITQIAGTTPMPERDREVDQGGTANTLEDVIDDLIIVHPNSVTCEIDLQTRKARIGRIELRNKGNKTIPGGWRAKVGLLRPIDFRVTLIDTIVLPIIPPKGTCPLGPYDADIPRDIIKSEDEWHLELYILDPLGNEELLYRSPSVSFV